MEDDVHLVDQRLLILLAQAHVWLATVAVDRHELVQLTDRVLVEREDLRSQQIVQTLLGGRILLGANENVHTLHRKQHTSDLLEEHLVGSGRKGIGERVEVRLASIEWMAGGIRLR